MSQRLDKQRDVAGFVLAGGRSSRMGVDKALEKFGGKRLICHAIEVLQEAGLPVAIAGARGDLTAFGPVILDAAGANTPLGPLSGICSALETTEAQFAVFLPVDMPLIPPELIRALVNEAQVKNSPVILPRIGGFAETFPVVLQRTVLPVLLRELRDGRRGCFAALRLAAEEAGGRVSPVPVENMVQAGLVVDAFGIPPHLWFLNVNTPEDLAQAESIYRRAHRVS